MRSMPSIAAISSQQPSEIGVPVAIGVDRLPEQHDLPDAVCSEVRRIPGYRVGRDAALASAHVRHDAEGAEAIASAHHGYVGARTAAVIGVEAGVGLAAVQAHVNDRVEARPPEELGQPPIAVRSRDQVQVRRLFDQLRRGCAAPCSRAIPGAGRAADA